MLKRALMDATGSSDDWPAIAVLLVHAMEKEVGREFEIQQARSLGNASVFCRFRSKSSDSSRFAQNLRAVISAQIDVNDELQLSATVLVFVGDRRVSPVGVQATFLLDWDRREKKWSSTGWVDDEYGEWADIEKVSDWDQWAEHD